jgi:hypothetical protein
MPADKITEILEYFVEINLFTKTSSGQYQCLKMNDKLAEYMKRERREKAKKEQDKHQSGSVETPSQPRTNTGVTPGLHPLKESKVKEKKLKESKPFLKPLQPTTKETVIKGKAGATLDSKSSGTRHSPLLNKMEGAERLL